MVWRGGNGGYTAKLRKVGLFSSCTNKELLKISTMCCATSARCGEVLTKQGAYGDQFFVILDGEATVWRNGKRIARLGGGDFFGEMALLDGNGRSGTVVAETDLELLVLSRTEFNSLALASPSVTRKITVALSARLRNVDDTLATERSSSRPPQWWTHEAAVHTQPCGADGHGVSAGT